MSRGQNRVGAPLIMLADFIPPCPRLHPGMMVRDDSSAYDHEYVYPGRQMKADDLREPRFKAV